MSLRLKHYIIYTLVQLLTHIASLSAFIPLYQNTKDKTIYHIRIFHTIINQ